MYYQKWFGNTRVWIKCSGEVEIRDTETNTITKRYINCDYRISHAQEQLMDDVFKSVEDVEHQIDMANAMDALVDKCTQFLLFGTAFHTGVLQLRLTDMKYLLVGFDRLGLKVCSASATINDYATNKTIGYSFDRNDMSSIMSVLKQFTLYKSPADAVNILTAIENAAIKVEEGEIPELMRIKTTA